MVAVYRFRLMSDISGMERNSLSGLETMGCLRAWFLDGRPGSQAINRPDIEFRQLLGSPPTQNNLLSDSTCTVCHPPRLV